MTARHETPLRVMDPTLKFAPDGFCERLNGDILKDCFEIVSLALVILNHVPESFRTVLGPRCRIDSCHRRRT
jgi:hypothetical protein